MKENKILFFFKFFFLNISYLLLPKISNFDKDKDINRIFIIINCIIKNENFLYFVYLDMIINFKRKKNVLRQFEVE